MLATENRRRQQRPQRLLALAETTGREASLDDILALQATQNLWQAVRDNAHCHLVWHRVWGDRLAGEAARTLREIADHLGRDAEAYVLWDNPPEAVRTLVAPLLRHEADHLSHQTRATLVSADAKSGLVLGWDHLSYADEYSLITWGDLAFDLTE
jgi:hypothetical protein